MTNILLGITAAVGIANLLSYVYGFVHVVARVETEMADRERRLAVAEALIQSLQADAKASAAMSATISDIKTEIARLRDRLDRFFDNRGEEPK